MTRLDSISVYITPDDFARLKQLKRHTGIPVNGHVRTAVSEYLNRKDRELVRASRAAKELRQLKAFKASVEP